jgi:glycosyltransferase involved in cell wall biosynthesis
LDLEVYKSLLTIVVPVHNMAGRLTNLSKWLDDAHAHNVKVILVHDKSGDSTDTELLQLLEMKNSRNFSLIQADVQSPGLARNLGLENIDTPWFSFGDSDDVVYISAILNLLDETVLSNSEIGIGSYISRDLRTGEERVIHPPISNKDALALHLAKKMGLWRFVLSTSCFGDIRFTNHKMGEDYLYTSQVIDRTNHIFTSSRVVYKYFYGGDLNLTSNQSVMSEMIGIIKSMKKTKPEVNIAVAFRVFSIQKLTLSVLKNLNAREKIIEKIYLIINLISHPIYLVKLFISLKIKSLGSING